MTSPIPTPPSADGRAETAELIDQLMSLPARPRPAITVVGDDSVFGITPPAKVPSPGQDHLLIGPDSPVAGEPREARPGRSIDSKSQSRGQGRRKFLARGQVRR